jgi:Mce-associated membrane protein
MSAHHSLGWLTTPLVAPLRLLSKGAVTVRGAWNRVYDGAVRRPAHAVRVLGLVVAVIAVIAGLCWFQTDRYSRLDAARAEAVREGEGSVGRLLSYDFRSMARQVEKTQDLVTGKFKDDYAQFVNTQVAPAARTKQVSVQTSVDRSAVVSSSLNEAVVLMYVDTDSEALLRSTGDTTVAALRVTLQKEDDTWRVSGIAPV